MYMHDCTCTWEASDSNDISSSDCAMDFLKVLFCFSKGRGKRERQRKRGGGGRDRADTHYTYIYNAYCSTCMHLASAMT